MRFAPIFCICAMNAFIEQMCSPHLCIHLKFNIFCALFNAAVLCLQSTGKCMCMNLHSAASHISNTVSAASDLIGAAIFYYYFINEFPSLQIVCLFGERTRHVHRTYFMQIVAYFHSSTDSMYYLLQPILVRLISECIAVFHSFRALNVIRSCSMPHGICWRKVEMLN